MQIVKEELDTIAFGRGILKINDIDVNADFSRFEKDYIARYNPLYVYARIPIEQIDKIHYMERQGFNFIETQFQMKKRLSRYEEMTPFGNEYSFCKVTNKEELPVICSLSDRIMTVDRMFLDKGLKRECAQKRYHLYLEKSFNSPDENLFKTIYNPTGEIIAFHSHKIVDDKNILFYIGGVIPEFRCSGACFAHEYLVFNYLYEHGFKRVITHISAANYNIINLEMRTVGFKPVQTFVILRKIYS